MTTLTIPRSLAAKGELVVISMEEYDKLVNSACGTCVDDGELDRAISDYRTGRCSGPFSTIAEGKRSLARRTKRTR